MFDEFQIEAIIENLIESISFEDDAIKNQFANNLKKKFLSIYNRGYRSGREEGYDECQSIYLSECDDFHKRK